MTSRDQKRVRKFYAALLSHVRKWLIKIGSPFRISRKFIRNLLNNSRSATNSGFVLPTVVLVTVVVTLLVITLVARSADRARVASDTRAEQVFESAAAPIIDRARAKIEDLINNDQLGRSTPSETRLNDVMLNQRYTFADETRLQIVSDGIDGITGSINRSAPDLGNREFINTAWKFPIDTDNNGKFDSFGLYSINFRTRPAQSANTRRVSVLESRTPPMDESGLSGACSGAGSANVATNEGWTPTASRRLKKAFYIYAATVPIRDAASFPALGAQSFEVYRGTSAIKALELQQDRSRNPLNNNAAWFEGDLEIVRPATFRFNGRMYAGGNLMLGALDTEPITLYQVSSSGTATSPDGNLGSCYYDRNNAEINVAGNTVEGDAINTTANATTGPVTIDLFRGSGVRPDLAANNARIGFDETRSTITQSASEALTNDFAFNRRVQALVDAAIALNPSLTITRSGTTVTVTSGDPPSVKSDLSRRVAEEGLFCASQPCPPFDTARRRALEVYFSARTRKIPYNELGFNPPADPTPTLQTVPDSTGTGLDLVPPFEWMIPGYTNGGILATGFTNALDFDGKGLRGPSATSTLTLRAAASGTLSLLAAADPEKRAALQPPFPAPQSELFIGDRVRVGNNLPARWLTQDSSGNNLFVADTGQNDISTNGSVLWNRINIAPDPTVEDQEDNVPPLVPRYRNTRAFSLDNLGDTGRGGFWELSAADDPSNNDPNLGSNTPPNPSPTSGGLRVVTNAGIYSRLPSQTFLTRFYTGQPDNPATVDIDESAAPLWDGLPQDNPITEDDLDPNAGTRALNEATFGNLVVWPDTMPMSGSIVYLDATARPFTLQNGTTANFSVPLAEAGYYPLSPSGVPTIDGLNQGTPVNTATVAQRTTARAIAARKGDLQMRATAVYHYKADSFDPLSATAGTAAFYQAPIACVSSYYDPSSPDSARNLSTLPWNPNARGRSNNGIVYNVSDTAASLTTLGGVTFNEATDKFENLLPNSNDPAVSAGGVSFLASRLAYQANLMFPNGRFANEPLRNVLRRVLDPSGGNGNAVAARLTLSEQSTLDSNICALQILDGTLAVQTATPPVVAGAQLPHGTIREAAFLDPREVKALNINESLREGVAGTTGNLLAALPNRPDLYDLEVEQRQPLEIRTTDLDVDRLRGSTVTGAINTGVATEFLLPYSGLIYASREDALPDLSFFDTDTGNLATGVPIATSLERRLALSSTDFKLDPTRRPNGIRLINGYRLFRSSLNTANLGNTNGTAQVSSTTQPGFTEPTRGEKGLILASNLPVYVRAQRDPLALTNNERVGFNKHTQEEFIIALNENTASVATIWDNFYTRLRSNINPNFACRPGSNNGNCVTGDQWRPATVLADTSTVLSGQWRDGYRSDGDFDIRNNANTSTSLNWQNTLNPIAQKRKDSFYSIAFRKQGFFNNNYVTSANWQSTNNSDGIASGATQDFPRGNRDSYLTNGVTPIQRRGFIEEYNMEICRKIPVSDCTPTDWSKNGAGTTTLTQGVAAPIPPASGSPRYISPEDSRYPRRVAFLRYDDIYGDGNKSLVLAGTCPGSNNMWFIPYATESGQNLNGHTYPQVQGDLATNFNFTNRRSYGDVPCAPPQGATVDIQTAPGNPFEGRFRTNTNNFPATLPAVNWAVNTTTNTGDLGATEVAYTRFVYQIRGQNLTSAPSNVTVQAALESTGQAVLGAVGDAIPNNNNLNASTTDVLSSLYNVNCLDAGGAAIAPGTVIGTAANPIIFRNTGAATKFCQVAALVVRDRSNEGNETFRLRLSSAVNALITGANPQAATIQQVQGTGATNTVNAAANYLANIVLLPPNAGCPTPAQQILSDVLVSTTTTTTTTAPDDGLVDTTITNTPQRQRTVRNGVSNCTPTPTPSPTPVPTPTPGGVMLPPPVFGVLPAPLSSGNNVGLMAATYPFPNGNYPNVCGSTNIRGYNCDTPTQVGGGASVPGNIFGESVPPYPLTEVGNPTRPIPMLPGMTRDRPTDQNRTLWFRAPDATGDVMGIGTRVNHRRDRNLFFYVNNWPTVSNASSNTANLNTGPRLVLPETVCFNSTDGRVDERCLGQTDETQGNTTGVAPVPPGFANLNLPFNPHYPSDQTSATGASAVIPASAYAICGVTGNNFNVYQSIENLGRTDITGGSCPNAIRTVINSFYADLAFTPGITPLLTNGVNPGGSPLDANGDTSTFTAQNTFADNRVNVINLNNLVTPADSLGALVGAKRTISGTLTLQSNRVTTVGAPNIGASLGPSPVFILKADTAEDIILSGLRLNLDGVEPNNVFWVIQKTGREALTITGDKTNPSNLVGNFMGVMPATAGTGDNSSGLNIGKTADPTNTVTLGADNANAENNLYVSLRGARFLGFRALPVGAPDLTGGGANAIGVNPFSLVVAMTSVDQPILLPVLQLHAPTTDTNTSDAMPRGTTLINGIPANNGNGEWTMRATRLTGNADATPVDKVEVNVYFVAGNNPSRSRLSYTPFANAPGVGNVNTAEPGSGLPNFVRELENWQGVPLKIAGGFIQSTRSRFATAPFTSTFPYVNFTNTGSDTQTLWINRLNTTTSTTWRLSNFLKFAPSVTGNQVIPYYSPPLRLFGFDVGLLTQAADRFAERFSSPIPGADEFFRDSDTDDPWVTSLLCALEPDNPTTLNPAASPINPNQPQRVGTIPDNYRTGALRGKDRPGLTTPGDRCPSVGSVVNPSTITYN